MQKFPLNIATWGYKDSLGSIGYRNLKNNRISFVLEQASEVNSL